MPSTDTEKVISSAVFYTDKQSFLAIHPTNLDYWEIPKGQIDGGERPEDAAVREFKEETGITIQKQGLQYMGYCCNSGSCSTLRSILYLLLVKYVGEFHK